MSTAGLRERFRTFFSRCSRTWPGRYAFAVLAVAVATALHFAFEAFAPLHQALVFFYLAVVLAAMLAGFGPGILATLLAAVSAGYFFLEPRNSFKIQSTADIARLIVFLVIGMFFTVLTCSRNRATEALKKSERRFRATFERSPVGIGLVDSKSGRFLNVNPKYCEILGRSKEEVLQLDFQSVTHPEDVAKSLAARDELVEGKSAQVELVKRYVRRDGKLVWVNVNVAPVTSPEEPRMANLTIVQDITERKQAEEALRRSEEDYRNFVARSSEGIFREDLAVPVPIDLPEDEMIARIRRDSYVTECNDALAKMYGFNSAQEMIGKRLADMVVTEDPRNLRLMREFVRGGFRVLEHPSHEVDQQGNAKVFLNSMMGVVENGILVRTWGIQRDVTEQVKLEEARTRAEEALRASEEHFRILVEQAPDGIGIADADGRWIDVNSAWIAMLGFTREEVLQQKVGANVVEKDRPRVAHALSRLENGETACVELTVQRKDGSLFPVEIIAKRLPDGRFQVIAHDISERKRAEEALRASEERFRSVYENSTIGIYRTTPDGRILLANPALVKMLGFSSFSELSQRNLEEDGFEPGCDRAEFKRRLADEGEIEGLESSWTKKDGAAIVVRESAKAIRDAEGNIAYYEGTVEDITERRRAEEALTRSEEKYRTLFERAVAGIAITNLEGKLIDCNDAFARMFGYSRAEEVKGIQIKDVYVNPANRDVLVGEVKRQGWFLNCDWHVKRKDGTPFWILISSILLQSEDEPLIQSTVIDITERKAAEEALRQSEERFRVALKHSPITVFTLDHDLRCTWAYNPRFHLQPQDVVGKTDDEIIGPEAAAPLNELKRRVLKTGRAVRTHIVLPYGGEKHAYDVTLEALRDANGKIVGITGTYVDVARLRELADRLEEQRDKLAQEKSYLQSEIHAELGFEKIIGQTPALREVEKKARVVAPTDSTVLLLGETGTGKELVARSIHSLSSRHDRSFIKLNCAAVPTGLLESELFGHEKGAFTGAVSQKIGRIELADKGTLLLDEVGELPLELQPKLLRVLQDHEFERLGGVRTLHVDVRIIAATNRDLQQAVADRKFREDLFYRLNVFPIHLPPLRQRRADIPMLVHHFVRKHAERMRKQIETIPDETMRMLENWSWPGNVRELENVIERMVILTQGRVLAAPPMELEAAQDLRYDNLTEMEREHIIRVLRETNGVLSGADGAASRLGVKRTTLQSMLKRLGIEPQEFRRGTGTFGRE